MSRGDLIEVEWRILKVLLPVERAPGKRGRGRPPEDNRNVINGILWRLRTGAPWRDVPEKYGNWNSIYRRFRRWSANGIWESVAVALAETMAESGHYNIDGTTVRAHVSATGGKGGFINELLADRGAGSPVKFIVSVMPEAIATRYDQLADSLLAMLFLASARYWLQICPRSLATGIDDFVNAIISDQSAGKVKF